MSVGRREGETLVAHGCKDASVETDVELRAGRRCLIVVRHSVVTLLVQGSNDLAL